MKKSDANAIRWVLLKVTLTLICSSLPIAAGLSAKLAFPQQYAGWCAYASSFEHGAYQVSRRSPQLIMSRV
jgi:hypothetical protein